MSRMRLPGLLALILVLSSAGYAKDQKRIRWIASPEESAKIDRSLAERLYDEACRWVEDQFSQNGKPVQPTLIIHVGVACPADNISNACVSPGTGELYLPRWDEYAPGVIVHATIVIGTLQLVQQQDMDRVVNHLLEEETRDFVDAKSFRRR